ncbi:hypothetical protein BKA82DRAFT_4144645 [Pisolithus tinctorius]|nr:hypothetical protein BKA82DRAFT_4144645 [Pisolithus tinctorius]
MEQTRIDAVEMQNILKSLPGLFQKAAGQVDIPTDAAQSLQALAQAGMFPIQGANQQQLPHAPHQVPVPHTTAPGVPGISDPGPSSHPSGPPNLGQLSAAAVAVQGPQLPQPQPQEISDVQNEGGQGEKAKPNATTGGRASRGGRNPAMGTDEWARQRKDNHKEVERRRRGNINEGIDELGRIVPNSSGEKAKGAILTRAVQYIHHLKENEARNIEKWTLEKLLMDQAMGDLQAQLEEMRRLWEEERMARQRAESELELLRGVSQANTAHMVAQRPQGHESAPSPGPRSHSPEHQENVVQVRSNEESRPDVEKNGDGDPADGRSSKRPRTE